MAQAGEPVVEHAQMALITGQRWRRRVVRRPDARQSHASKDRSDRLAGVQRVRRGGQVPLSKAYGGAS